MTTIIKFLPREPAFAPQLRRGERVIHRGGFVWRELVTRRRKAMAWQASDEKQNLRKLDCLKQSSSYSPQQSSCKQPSRGYRLARGCRATGSWSEALDWRLVEVDGRRGYVLCDETTKIFGRNSRCWSYRLNGRFTETDFGGDEFNDY